MIGHGQVGIPQGAVQRGPHFVNRYSAARSSSPLTNTAGVASTPTASACFIDAFTALSSCALMQDCNFTTSTLCFSALQHGELVQRIQARAGRFFVAYLVLVGVNVIGKVPISVAALRRQAVGIHRGVHCPGMNFHQWIVLVEERDPVAVLLEYLREQCLVHARAKRAFQIVEVHQHDLGCLGSASGRPLVLILPMVSANGSLVRSNLVSRIMEE